MKTRSLLKLSGATLLALCLSTAAQAQDFNIPGGDLGSALSAYTNQTGQPLVVSGEAVRGIKTRGVSGNLSPDAALSKLLTGTGFTIKRDSGVLAVVPTGRQSHHEINPLQLAQAQPTGRIEEVLVTARKREEAVENIPISITALSADDLKNFGVRNFTDLEGVVPGLNMGGGGNGVKKDGNPFIRGVGQRETKVTLDPAVATYIEGIYIGRAGGALMDVVDVESIQVLRGPQGTLFGKNATGGAISVSLKKPNNNWEAQVSANIGNFGRRDISGTVNIPFVEDFVMGRLTIASTNSNGYFTNIVDNTKWGGDNRVTGIAQLRILPTDRITIDLFGEKTRIRETPRPQRCEFVRASGFASFQGVLMNNNRPLVDGYKPYEGYCRRSTALPPSQFASDEAIGDLMPRGRYWVDTSTAAATINWDIGTIGPVSDLSAKSISAWRKSRQIADEDLDAVPEAYLIRVQPDFDETMQWSQELSISGKAFRDRLFVSTGVFYFKERTPQSDLLLSAGMSGTEFVATPTTAYPNGRYRTWFAEAAKERLQTDNWSFAWYGQADFDITPQIQLTGGARWTTETRWSRYSKAYVNMMSVLDQPTQGFGSSGAFRWDHATPTIYPIMQWRYQSPVYSKVMSGNNETLVTTYVPDLFIGDELTFKNSAWTPMASLKYKMHDRLLEKFRLDQAMIYATYSQGFHSGGVTSGAIEMDKGIISTTNRPDRTNIPCPNNATSCTFITLPEPGFGTADPITFKPEKLTNYEVGFKLAGLDRRMQANLAAFYMTYADMQVTAVGTRFGIPVPYIDNVGKSVIKGIEAEIVAMPMPNWRLTVTGSYTDADIKEWLSRAIPLDLDGAIQSSSAGAPQYDLDRSDERMPRVPRWQFFTSTEYNFRLPGGGSITPSVGVRFSSSIYHGFDRGSWTYSYGGYYYNHGGDVPPTYMPSFGLCTAATPAAQCNWNGADRTPVQADPLITPSPDAKWTTTSRPTAFLDARMAWNSDDGKMEAALWGKNLTNKDDYLVGGIPLADVTGAVGQVFANPRTFGLTFTYHFGQ